MDDVLVFLTTAQVADILKVGKWKVIEMVAAGDIPNPLPPFPGKFRWKKETIDNWIEEGCPHVG